MTLPTMPKPRRPAQPKKPPVLTEREMLNTEEQQALYDELDAMPSEELVKTAFKLGLSWENVPKARLIEQIIAVEIDRTRAQEAEARKMRSQQQGGPKVPKDPDVKDGMLYLSPTDLAIVCAALLPPDAIWTAYNKSVQTYSKQSKVPEAFTEGTEVIYSRMGSDGHERRYRIRFAELTPLEVEPLP